MSGKIFFKIFIQAYKKLVLAEEKSQRGWDVAKNSKIFVSKTNIDSNY